ncbi:MAG: lysophospholipid acyltransferase family protein [Bacteroidetes bacterium]|nr:lysophospholipid acyltransferase family protein [Bacteroidota bacterium]
MSDIISKLKHIRFVRALVYVLVGIVTYPGIAIFNKLKIEGAENLKKLPKKNVLFVSNHQTYFAEVITFLHIFCAVKWGKKNALGLPWYLMNPFTGVFFVSAAATMRQNSITRLFELAGSITVKRTWNDGSKEERKGLDPSDTRKIDRALKNSWIINFPQGTTTPFAEGRKGTVLLIKQNHPIVIPIVINGFNTAFDKKGLRMIKKNTILTVKFKEPLLIDYSANNNDIMETIMIAIEQSKSQQECVI